MMQKLKTRLKDQKGFTLIELLAVIVILGVIAAIAVPSVMNIMNNSKKDAQVANAKQMVNATKLYIANNNIQVTTTGQNFTMNTLTTSGVLDTVQDPSGTGYDTTASLVNVKLTSSSDSTVIYTVTLINKPSSGTATKYIDAKDISTLVRGDVTLP